MKNTFKKGIASLLSLVTLTTGAIGISASATDVSLPNESIDTTSELGAHILSTSYFTFSDVTSGGAYAYGSSITLTKKTTVDFSFGHCTAGEAHVSIRNASNNNEAGHFNIPATAGTTLHAYVTLPAGNYVFYVTPRNCNSTSGSFTAIY